MLAGLNEAAVGISGVTATAAVSSAAVAVAVAEVAASEVVVGPARVSLVVALVTADVTPGVTVPRVVITYCGCWIRAVVKENRG